MGPFTKARLLTVPLNSNFLRSFHQYEYEEPSSETEDYDDEDEAEEDEDQQEEQYAPVEDLAQKRAQLQYKLKSQFEAIFDKYERDFDGIGDEIDLRTGDIVVNNGHLLDMQHERDAGDGVSGRSMVRTWTAEPKLDVSSSLEEEEGEDISDDYAINDDMVHSRFPPPIMGGSKQREFSPELTYYDGFRRSNQGERAMANFKSSNRRGTLPSGSEMVPHFWPRLGQDMSQFISPQRFPDERNIEPAWRIPVLSLPVSQQHTIEEENIEPAWRTLGPTLEASGRRCVLQPIITQPEIERSASPESAPSIWAPKRLPGRPVKRNEVANIRPTKPRREFTAEEDKMLIERVTRAQDEGISVWSKKLWKEFESDVEVNLILIFAIH